MTDARPLHGALERSLSALLIDAPEAQAEREAQLEPLRGSDMSQVLQVSAAGLAARQPIWTEQELIFPYPFVQNIDPTAADSGLENPHFATGVELLTGDNVMIDAQVRGWVYSPEGWVTGARVRISAWAPNARKKVRYSAVVHLTFSGYATPTDDESEA